MENNVFNEMNENYGRPVKNSKKMRRSTKRTLIIVGTIVGALAIALLIAFMPSCSKEEEGKPNNSTVEIPTAGAESSVYEDMTKEELIKILKDRDAEIKVLKDQAEIYSDVDNVVVGVPTGGSSSGSGNKNNLTGENNSSSNSTVSNPTDDDTEPSTDETTDPSGNEMTGDANDEPVYPSTDVPEEPPVNEPVEPQPENSGFSDTGL